MWREISVEKERLLFLEEMHYFHDSCIKELRYISGAHVNNDLSMYPINDRRLLRVVIQRQFKDCPMIELEFQGLQFLKLSPVEDTYTCEIQDCSMFFKNGCVYWADHKNVAETNIDSVEGTVICASKCRWRPIENNMGSADFYYSL